MATRLAFIALALLSGCARACESESVTQPPPRLDGLGLERAFGGARFDRPVLLTAPPGMHDRVFVVEQGGRIFAVDTTVAEPSPKLFLDLSAKVSREGNEEGLLGLAFHPGYADNGRLFVDYTAHGMVSVVSELLVSADDRDRADPDSERTVLTQDQPYRNHNGGMIAFGPDGFLYIGFGDGGAGGDPHKNGQLLGTWLGKILRIDVDAVTGDERYAVPIDNPFVGSALRRPEIWAFGLRNPWRFSFDRGTGALWAGDVGQDRFEEVDVVVRGGNYGWRVFEGDELFEDESLSRGDHIPPVVAYGRNEGRSVTGGYVYRGDSLPVLQGVYVFGDYDSGRIWGILPTSAGFERRLLIDSGKSIASFGEDAAGELYACAFDGGIYRFVANAVEPPNVTPLPARLSELGMFSDVAAGTPAADAVAYEVNAPLWSDGAAKRRWVRVSSGQRIGFSANGAWTFPDGTTFAKTFELSVEGTPRRLETRIIRTQAGYWQAASYLWNAAQTDADLVGDGASIELDPATGLGSWQVPSSAQCRSCHTDAAGFVLGPETAQLNRDGQLAEWMSRGILEGLPADLAGLPALARPEDEAAGLEARARAYLHANCAQCHRPGGPGNAAIDLRWSTALADTRMVDVAPAQGDLGVAGARIIAPGDPDRSTLVLRMATRELGAMPPLATQLVDEPGVELVRAWVGDLSP